MQEESANVSSRSRELITLGPPVDTFANPSSSILPLASSRIPDFQICVAALLSGQYLALVARPIPSPIEFIVHYPRLSNEFALIRRPAMPIVVYSSSAVLLNTLIRIFSAVLIFRGSRAVGGHSYSFFGLDLPYSRGQRRVVRLLTFPDGVPTHSARQSALRARTSAIFKWPYMSHSDSGGTVVLRQVRRFGSSLLDGEAVIAQHLLTTQRSRPVLTITWVNKTGISSDIDINILLAQHALYMTSTLMLRTSRLHLDRHIQKPSEDDGSFADPEPNPSMSFDGTPSTLTLTALVTPRRSPFFTGPRPANKRAHPSKNQRAAIKLNEQVFAFTWVHDLQSVYGSPDLTTEPAPPSNALMEMRKRRRKCKARPGSLNAVFDND